MLYKTDRQRYERRCQLQRSNVEVRHEDKDKNWRCGLCGSQHYGRWTRVKKKNGRIVRICEGCRMSLSNVTVYDTEEELKYRENEA